MWSILRRESRAGQKKHRSFDELVEGHSKEEIGMALLKLPKRSDPSHGWAVELRKALKELPPVERVRCEGAYQQHRSGPGYGGIADFM